MPVGTDGSLAVDEYLHVLGYPQIFGGGDCIWFTPHRLDRAGVFAVRQGPVLLRNVWATVLHGPGARLRRFRPGAGYLLLVNLADGTALLWRRILGVAVAFRSRAAWRLKDRIDSGFMRRFGSEAVRAAEGRAE